jgi:hypothetical protein
LPCVDAEGFVNAALSQAYATGGTILGFDGFGGQGGGGGLPPSATWMALCRWKLIS